MGGCEVASGIEGWGGETQVDEVADMPGGCQGVRGIEC